MALVSRSAALCALALLALACPAVAGPPGSWTKVHDADANTTEVGVARSSNGLLNVLWTRDSDNAVLNSQISANAANVLGPHTLINYAGTSAGVSSGVQLLPAPGGGLRAFFAGLYPGNPLDERMATATSSDGVAWSVQPTPASDDRTGMGSPVYAASGIGGTLATNGVPISIWGDSSPGAAGYHVGTSSTDPDVHFGGSSATVGGPNAATDSSTGQIVIGWNDLDSGRTLVQSIAPAGARMNTPSGEAPDALERVGMSGRDGPGIFVAYLRGTNPFDSKMAVWRVGAGNPMVLSPKDARFPGVARGPDGRLWAYWVLQRIDYRIFAARSNEAATQFGAAVEIKPPSGTDSVSSLEGEGTASGGSLDLLALVSKNGGVANYHQRILPGITVQAKKLGDGAVRITTLDAGERLATKVRLAGEAKKTGPDGRVVMTAEQPGDKRRSKETVRVTRNGYHPAVEKAIIVNY